MLNQKVPILYINDVAIALLFCLLVVNIPDVYLTHLQVAVYSLFHRLYGMYPCHFLTYLRNIYTKADNQQAFKETIMVRLSILIIIQLLFCMIPHSIKLQFVLHIVIS